MTNYRRSNKFQDIVDIYSRPDRPVGVHPTQPVDQNYFQAVFTHYGRIMKLDQDTTPVEIRKYGFKRLMAIGAVLVTATVGAAAVAVDTVENVQKRDMVRQQYATGISGIDNPNNIQRQSSVIDAINNQFVDK